MRSFGDTPHPPVSPSSPQVGTTPAQEIKIRQPRKRVTHADQLNCAPRLREIQQASQTLTQILESREIRIAALRRDIESGHYTVKAEQIAEKIMEDHLLDLFYS